MAIKNFNETIDIWISGLNLFTIDQLLIKPEKNMSWSLGQVYEHIIEETNWYNEQLEISLKDVKNANTPSTSEAKTLFKAKSLPIKGFKAIR